MSCSWALADADAKSVEAAMLSMIAFYCATTSSVGGLHNLKAKDDRLAGSFTACFSACLSSR
jgi:hypothetical protein